jgi:hypothetical protein
MLALAASPPPNCHLPRRMLPWSPFTLRLFHSGSSKPT